MSDSDSFHRILQSDLSPETRRICEDLRDSLAIKVPSQKMSGLHARSLGETPTQRYVPEGFSLMAVTLIDLKQMRVFYQEQYNSFRLESLLELICGKQIFSA